VGVRKVALPADVVDVELVEQLDADAVTDEATEDSFPEELGRRQSLRPNVTHPAVVAVKGVLGTPEEVWDPPDVTFRQRESQLGEPVPERRPQQIAQRVDG